MAKEIGSRQGHIDIVAGFCILYMINVHLSDWNWCTKLNFPEDSIWNYITFPFMAWFFYKAGMFFKRKNYRESFCIEVRKLLWPFLWFTIFGHLIHCIRMWVEFGDRSLTDYLIVPVVSILLRGSSNGNFALWFLPSLLCVKVVSQYIYQKGFDFRYALVGSWIFAYLVVLVNGMEGLPKLPGNEHVTLPVWFANISMGLSFYIIGYLLRTVQYQKWAVLLAIICFAVQFLFNPCGYGFRTMSGHGSLLLWTITSVASIVLVNNIAYRVPLGWTRLQVIGKYAMVVYVIHWPLLTLSRLLFLSGCGIEEGWMLRGLQTFFIIVASMILIKSGVLNRFLVFQGRKSN